MSIRVEHIDWIAGALNKKPGDCMNSRRELNNQTLNDICSHLGIENRGETYTSPKARTLISEFLGENMHYSGRQRLGWRRLKEIADMLQDIKKL